MTKIKKNKNVSYIIKFLKKFGDQNRKIELFNDYLFSFNFFVSISNLFEEKDMIGLKISRDML